MADIKQIQVGSSTYNIDADKLDGHDSSYFAPAVSGGYLPLSGGTMTGPVKWAGATQELISTAYSDSTWKGGIKYSWASNTTLGIWGKHQMSQFVWHAGTDFSSNDVNGTTTKTYDFQIGRDSSGGAPIGRIGGNIIIHAGNIGSYAITSFAGSGSATTAARSDHNHDGTYLKLSGGGTVNGNVTLGSEDTLTTGYLNVGNAYLQTSDVGFQITQGSNIAYIPPSASGALATQSYVGNGTLTIQKNGTNVATFTANQSGNSTANISVPVNLANLSNRNQALIEWGGPDLVGNASPLDVAIIDDLGHNKFAFMSAASVVIQYSRDGGSTWTDYGSTDNEKRSLVTLTGSFSIGKRTGSNNTVNDKLRVILNSNNAGGNVYTSLRRLLFYVSTNGSGGSNVKIETRTIGNYRNNVDTWADNGTHNLSGWSGWNSPEFACTFGGSNDQTSQIAQIRLTFGVTSVSTTYGNFQLLAIRAIGFPLWGSPSTMASTGHLYSFDIAQNATFPAGVSATSFTENGTTLANKYQAKGTYVNTVNDKKGAVTVSGSFSGTAATITPTLSAGTTKYLSASFTGTKTNSLVTGVSVNSQGSVTLTANDATATGRITYVESISGSAPSLGGTKTFVTGYGSFSGGSGSLTSNDTSSGGIAYIASHTNASLGTASTASVGISGGSYSSTTKYLSASFSGTAATITPSLTGTKTFVTGYPNFSGGGSTTKYLHHSHTAASLGTASTGTVGISGASYTPAGSVTITSTRTTSGSGTAARRILTITGSFSGTAATITPSLTGTKTFVTGYPDFSGGSGSLTSNDTASGGIAYIATHTNASLGTASTGTVGISGASYTPAGSITLTVNDATDTGRVTYVQSISGSAPSLTGTTTFVTGYPNFSGGGSTTKYLHHSHTGASLGTASTGTVSISGGSYSATTKYLSASHSGTTLTVSKGDYTPAGSVSLTANTSTATGRITYLEAQGSITGASYTPAGSVTISATN